MNTHTFIKEQGDWYIDFPHYLQEFNGSFIAQIEGSDDLLELLSGGNETVTIAADTRPFEKAMELELVAHDDTAADTGCYRIRNQQGKLIPCELWLSDVPLFIFGELPERIYIRKEQPLLGEE